MEKTLSVGEKTVTYTLKTSPRTRAMRVAVYHDGRLVVTAPERMNTLSIERFLESKSAWIFDKMDHFKKNPRTVLPKHTAQEIRSYKEQALTLISSRLLYYNQFYGFAWKRISIKNTTSRWGSCSKLGNLNFSYKLALLPPELSDYIIVHELCHLGELNHSRDFWKLVEKTIPDYKDHRYKLKNIL